MNTPLFTILGLLFLLGMIVHREYVQGFDTPAFSLAESCGHQLSCSANSVFVEQEPIPDYRFTSCCTGYVKKTSRLFFQILETRESTPILAQLFDSCLMSNFSNHGVGRSRSVKSLRICEPASQDNFVKIS